MDRFQIPGTKLVISELCMGTGDFGTEIKGRELDRLVAAFVESGGCFFDTAHCYAFWRQNGDGASERELGACLRRLNCPDDMVIATKGGHPHAGADYQRPDAYLSEEVIASDLDESLSRLGIECVDLYYLHRDDVRVPVSEIIGTLNREIERGRVRAIGASNWSVSRIAAANEYAAREGLHGFTASELQWSLATPNWKPGPDPTTRYVTPEDAAWHASAGIPIVAYTATGGGFFSKTTAGAGSFDSPINAARRRRAQELAERLGSTPTQIALAYLLHQKVRVVPLFSTAKMQHLEEAINAASIDLGPAQVRWLHDG